MKHLGIDFGIKRVGLAVSDPDGTLAFPCKTLYRTTRDALFEELAALIEAEGIEVLVLGRPDAGGDPLILRQIDNFAQSLERRFQLPVHVVDEQLTSHEAELRLRDMGVKAKKQKGIIDQLAATIILETFLLTRSG